MPRTAEIYFRSEYRSEVEVIRYASAPTEELEALQRLRHYRSSQEGTASGERGTQ